MTNYTEEETAYIIKAYLDSGKDNAAIDRIAATVGKNKKSVIGKLSREGIYEKQTYRSKTGDLPVTKKELVYNISMVLNLDPEKVAGLEKAPKNDLKYMLTQITQEPSQNETNSNN